MCVSVFVCHDIHASDSLEMLYCCSAKRSVGVVFFLMFANQQD